jgi:hypothetical protein
LRTIFPDILYRSFDQALIRFDTQVSTGTEIDKLPLIELQGTALGGRFISVKVHEPPASSIAEKRINGVYMVVVIYFSHCVR